MASLSPTQLAASNRVRREWQGFHKAHSAGRAALEHKVEALKSKADQEYSRTATQSRIPQSAHDATKARLVKDLREKYFEGLRSKWQAKLVKAGLKDEQWVDMSDQEMTQVLHLLGSEDESDEDMVYVAPPGKPIPLTQPSLFYTPGPASVAPSISTSTRVSNASSASSYAFVNPSEFHSEEEDYFFNPHMSSSHEVTSDEDEGAISSASHPTRRRVDPFGSWSDSEPHVGSSHNSIHSGYESSSATRPRASNFTYNRSTSSARQAALAREKAREIEKEQEKEPPSTAATPGGASGSKPSTPDRALYIGPAVYDPEDNLADEDDFERFKMQMRFQKIAEYHQAAALAEIQLSIKVYRARKSGEQDTLAGLLSDHQTSMSQLQATKEDERKDLVDKERARRRPQSRPGRRPGRSNTILAPTPSAPTNPTWLHNLEDTAPEDVGTKFDLEKLISNDPTHQNVEAVLQQMHTEAAAKRPAHSRNASLMPTNNPTHSFSGTGSDFQAAAMEMTAAMFEPKPQWSRTATSSSAVGKVGHQAQQNTANGSSASSSIPHPHRRRESDAARYKTSASGRASTKPSPFGEDDSSSDEDDGPAQRQAVPPPPRQSRTNSFAHMSSRVVDEFQNEPHIAAAFHKYAGIATPAPTPAVAVAAAAPPPWNSRTETQTPMVPGGWPSKDAAGSRPPPVASGWNKRRAGASTPVPENVSGYTSSTAIPTRSQFGYGDDRAAESAFASSARGVLPMSSKGKTPMIASEEQGSVWQRGMAAKATQEAEPQESIWDKQMRKTTSPEVPQAAWARSSSVLPKESETTWGTQPSMFASEDRSSMWAKKAAPPAEDAHSGWGIKSMAISERQIAPTLGKQVVNQPEEDDSMKMQAVWSNLMKPAGNTADATTSKMPTKAPPVPPKVEKPSPPPPSAALNKKQAKKLRQNKKGGALEEPEAEPVVEASAAVEDQDAPSAMQDSIFDTPESMFSSTLTSMGRAIPGIGRARMDSFSAWESEVATTPRQPSKIPSQFMQDSTSSSKAESILGGARNGLQKKTDPSVSTSLFSQGTIKASSNPWGSATTTSAAQRTAPVWGMWGGGESKSAQQEVKEPSPERDSWSLGGFGGKGGDSGANDAEEQEDGGDFGGWGSSANGLGASDSMWSTTAAGKKTAPAAPVSAAATKTATPSKVATPVSAAVVGGKKGKKGKAAAGKKASVEEVPDEEETTRGETLPVDSRAILEDSQPILEPKPSVPSKLFDSIISYTDEEDEGGAAVVGKSSAPSAPVEAPEPETVKVGAWGASLNTKKQAEPEPKAKTPPPPPAPPAKATPAWGQAGGGKKGKKGRK